MDELSEMLEDILYTGGRYSNPYEPMYGERRYRR